MWSLPKVSDNRQFHKCQFCVGGFYYWLHWLTVFPRKSFKIRRCSRGCLLLHEYTRPAQEEQVVLFKELVKVFFWRDPSLKRATSSNKWNRSIEAFCWLRAFCVSCPPILSSPSAENQSWKLHQQTSFALTKCYFETASLCKYWNMSYCVILSYIFYIVIISWQSYHIIHNFLVRNVDVVESEEDVSFPSWGNMPSWSLLSTILNNVKLCLFAHKNFPATNGHVFVNV